jgi:hypothetical protein
VIEPGEDLVLHIVEHRGPFRDRLAAAIGSSMGRSPFALPPCRLEAGGEAVETDDDRLRLHWLRPTTIDALAQLGLSGADLGEQYDGIGLRMELPQPHLAVLRDRGMGKDAAHRWRRRVIALGDPGADALLLLQLEGWLKQVRVQPRGGVEPRQSLCGHQALETPIANEAPHDRSVLLFDMSPVVLAVGAGSRHFQASRSAPTDSAGNIQSEAMRGSLFHIARHPFRGGFRRDDERS